MSDIPLCVRPCYFHESCVTYIGFRHYSVCHCGLNMPDGNFYDGVWYGQDNKPIERVSENHCNLCLSIHGNNTANDALCDRIRASL
jgi:hypothetical protein